MHEAGNFLSLYGSNETEGKPIKPEIVDYLVVEATKYLNTHGKKLTDAGLSLKTVFDILGNVFIEGKYHLKILSPQTLAEYKEVLKAGFSLRKEFFDHSERTLFTAKNTLRDLALTTDELSQARNEWTQRFGLPRHTQLTQFVEKVDARNKTIPEIALYLLTSSLKLSAPQQIEKAQSYIPTLQKQSLIIRGKLFEILSNEAGAAANPLFITDDQLMSTVNNYMALDETEQQSIINRTQSQFLQNLPAELIQEDTEVLASQFLNQIDDSIQRWMRIQAMQTDQIALDEYWKKKDALFSILPVQAISPDLVEHQLLNQYTEIGAPSLWTDTTELNGIVFPSHKSIQAGLRLFKAAGYQKSAEFASLKTADNLMKNYYSTRRELENKIRRLQEQKIQIEEFLSENKDITEQTEIYPILEVSRKINKEKQTLRKYKKLRADREKNILMLDSLEKLKTQDSMVLKLGVLELQATRAINAAGRSLARLYAAYKSSPRIGSYLLETVTEFQEDKLGTSEESTPNTLVKEYSWCNTALSSLQQLLESITAETKGTASLFKLPKYLEFRDGDFRVFLLNKIIPRLHGRNDARREYLRKTGFIQYGTDSSEDEILKKVARDLRSKSEIWQTNEVSRFLQQILQEEIRLLSKSVSILANSIRAEKMLEQIKITVSTGQASGLLLNALEGVDDTRISSLSYEINVGIFSDAEIQQVTDTAVVQTRKLLAQYRFNTRTQSLRFPLDQDPMEFLIEHLRNNEEKEKKLRAVAQETLLRSLIEAALNNPLIPIEKFKGLTLAQIFEAIDEREALYELSKNHESIETSLATDQALLDQAKLLEKYQEEQNRLRMVTSQIQTSEEMLLRSDLGLTEGLLELNLAVSGTEYAQIQSTSTIIDEENE